MGNSQKTETSNAFKQLEIETVERAKLVSSVNEAAGYICKNLVKKRDLDAKSGNEAPLCNLMATALMAWAVTMQEHPMGTLVTRTATMFDKLALEQAVFADKINDSIIHCLDKTVEGYAEFDRLEKKLENRRLDFDAKLNKAQKAKKETPDLEEDVRSSQAKYEETLAVITEQMLHLNSEETYLSHSDGLNQFIESQIEYYQNCLNISQELKAQMSGDSKPQSLLRVPTAGAMPRSASENCISSTTRSTPPEDVVRRSFMASSISADPQAGRVHVMPTGESITSRQPLAKSMTTSNILQLPQSNSTISMPVPASSPDRLVKVLFDFDGETEKELSFKKGDIVRVIFEIDAGWWQGSIDGREGMFPANYTERHSVVPPQVAQRQRQSSGSPRTHSRSSSHGAPVPKESAFVASAAACGLCGCTDYIAHAFKPGQCNNCYHKH